MNKPKSSKEIIPVISKRFELYVKRVTDCSVVIWEEMLHVNRRPFADDSTSKVDLYEIQIGGIQGTEQ